MLCLLNLIEKIKQIKLKKQLSKCGEKVSIGSGIIVDSPAFVELGNNIYIGPNAVLYSTVKKIIFGNNIIVGPVLTMVSGNHNYKKVCVPIIENH